ncbi:hypothetical protein KFK09_024461 [Dendrobium nobile]|uniref:Uncharacterized protein n=1 Tax=Dendrobium nobile TaxID=94219 RepID=A0A8T3AD44_DENNO|nr:hypothetical protein KFK09_024461 [Dendrobium nobile]
MLDSQPCSPPITLSLVNAGHSERLAMFVFSVIISGEVATVSIPRLYQLNSSSHRNFLPKSISHSQTQSEFLATTILCCTKAPHLQLHLQGSASPLHKLCIE